MAEKVIQNWFVDYCYAQCHCAISVIMLLNGVNKTKEPNAILLRVLLLTVVMLIILLQCQYGAESQLC
jgi:uncharacterized membrane protein